MSEEVRGALPSLISLMVSVDVKQYLYVGSGTVFDPATLSEAALLWKSQHSNISADLFQLCCLAGREAPLLVSVTTVSGYKTLRSTL